MSLYQAAFFVLAVVLVLLVTARGRVLPLLALLVGAAGFGYAAGMSTSHFTKAFGLGFAQSVNGLGLTVLAAAFLAAIADAAGATAWLREKARGWRTRSAPLAALGLVSGVASTPAAAFAVLTPLTRAIGGGAPRAATTLGLSLSGAHGLLIPAPVMLASVTILAADWTLALAYGLPVAVLVTLIGLGYARATASGRPLDADASAAMDGDSLHAPRRAALALVLVSIGLIALLITQSLGDIASEPLGGGSNREFLLALGRPPVLLLAGVALMLLLSWHREEGALGERGWVGRGLASAAGLILLIGVAGGLAKMAQETGMAEMNAERLLGCRPAGALALLLPFAVAAAMKTLQGSSLVAAITAAGMMMELVAPLGLDDPAGRTLAALAIGAGAMTVSHLNDGLFWLVAQAGRLSPASAVARFSLGTAIQGGVALAALILLRLAAS
ncbi:GntP family permease [Ancylobacter oerskovii]|uniref:GntP family permease n=1 Tax=Ancylobacter oerskovii TaxID=459519 RepID=A0ABW4YWQ4_9HYPH|nr:GntP family permease [Ancylobacter oerskovii]MBS7542206.1 GntP family permease [Ancylobacter oerskovii]